MSLDVDSPEPPELAAVDPNEYEDAEVAGGEYRRDDLEALLHEGAWEDAFSEWSDTTDMDEETGRSPSTSDSSPDSTSSGTTSPTASATTLPGSPKTGRSATSTQISTRGDRLRD